MTDTSTTPRQAQVEGVPVPRGPLQVPPRPRLRLLHHHEPRLRGAAGQRDPNHQHSLIMITPAFSKDTLYLKCNVTSDFLITDLTTSQVVDNRSIDDTSILKIDLKASTAHDTRSEEAIDIIIKRKMAFMAQRINDNEVKLNDDGSLHLIPPYPLSGTGEAVYKSLREIVCIDQCPKKIGLHQYIVCNLSISQNQLGSHWIVSIF